MTTAAANTISNLREILASNTDGHLSINECLVIREAIERIEALGPVANHGAGHVHPPRRWRGWPRY